MGTIGKFVNQCQMQRTLHRLTHLKRCLNVHVKLLSAFEIPFSEPWRSFMTLTKPQASSLPSKAVPSQSSCFPTCSKLLQGNRKVITLVRNAKHWPMTAQVMANIDIDALREELKRKRKINKNTPQLIKLVQQAVKDKCDEAIANLSEEEKKELEVIKLEHSFWYSEGYDIPTPDEMTSENWLEALHLKVMGSRQRYYTYLQNKNYTKNQRRLMKQENKAVPERIPTVHYEHGRLFLMIYATAMMRYRSNKLAAAMQFGIPLVYDMSFHIHMTNREIRNTAKQMMEVFAFNRADPEPFHLQFLNCEKDNPIYKMFQLLFQESEDLLLTVSEKSYLDLHDKKDVIYLSPNAREVMHEFDPNAVYIIGALNDKSCAKPHTYAKSKKEGVRCLKLPLDYHLDWQKGGKDLTMDAMAKILMVKKNKGSWKEAFKHVPTRKLTP